MMGKYFFFLISLLGFTRNIVYGQAPFPHYSPVLIEDFNTKDTLNLNEWRTYYNWGPNYTNGPYCLDWCDHLNPPMDCAMNTQSQIDYTNRIIDSGVCNLITTKQTNVGYRDAYFPYPSDSCTANSLGPAPWNPAYCFYHQPVLYKYKSAVLLSNYLYKYGYFEIRFRLPTAVSLPGTYNSFSPGFWMYNSDSVAYWSELDVFEMNGYNYQSIGNLHYERTINDTDNHYNAHSVVPYTSYQFAVNTWHTASMEWTDDYVDFYYDGVFHDRLKDSANLLTAMQLIVDPFFAPSNFCIPPDSNNTPLPYNFEIDYVKVWQAETDCSTDKVYCNINQSSFSSKIYKSLSIGGSGCAATFNNGDCAALANDFVLLGEGTEIGNNMTMLIDTRTCKDNLVVLRSTDPEPIPNGFIQSQKSKQTQHSNE